MQKILQPWAISGEELLKELNSQKEGLKDKDAEERLSKYGSNTFHKKEKTKTLSIFLKQFGSPLIFLLIGAAILTAFLDEWLNTYVISFAVLLNVLLGFYHEFHAENTLSNLTTYIKDRARVIREGREEEIDSSLIVPGDIVKLSYGARVPADIRLFSFNNIRIDEAVLTGESIPVEKTEGTFPLTSEIAERKNIAHAGTLVVQGYATGVAYSTGSSTEIGKIASIVSKVDRTETPLQKGMKHVAWTIFGLVLVIVVGVFILGISRGEPLLPMLILSTAIAIGAVPEGLPIVLTVILAIGAERIASKKGVIKKLGAAETLGSTTLLMTDKTGTLTMADMKLVGIHSKEYLISSDFNTSGPDDFTHDDKKLLELSLTNVDVSVENPNAKKEDWIFRGRPFEVNIVKACRFHNVSIDKISSIYSSIVIPFNSTNKFSVAERDGSYVVMGAPDVLLKRSKIDKDEYVKIEKWIENISNEGKRLISIATFSKGSKKHESKHIEPEDIKDLNFLGVFVFFDPIRPEAIDAVKDIESYGMKVVIISGDLPGTAMSIAKELGWEVSKEEVLTGNTLRSLKDEELLNIIPKIKIFARVTPEDKLRVGKIYQKLGEVVAMTGDGVNDAPALKAMDIGVSLGSATDVAKSAADLVLLNDNLETISLAVEEGRKILSNIRKSFVYLMSNSLDDVFVVAGSLIFSLPLPLTALQIIWVNLFTGSLPALAFAFNEDMDKGEYSPREARAVFTKEVKVLIFGIGIVSSVLLFILYYWLIKSGLEVNLARSVFFVCFSSYILAIAFSFRSLRKPIFSYNPFSNKKLNWSIVLSLVLLIGTITIPFMRKVFELSPMPVSWLPFIFFWLILNILLVEVTKFILKKKFHLFKRGHNFKFYLLKK